MDQSKPLSWFYLSCLGFIGINTALIAQNNWYLALLPAALLVAWFYAFAFDKVFYLISFMVPLSVNFTDIGGGLGMNLPSEPLMFGLMCLLVVKFILRGEADKEILRHPITIAVILYLIWFFITILTSSMILVSIKAFLNRFWFISIFYFLGLVIFKRINSIISWIWLFLVPLAGTVAYTLIRHSLHGFDQKTSYWIMDPFFVNHGVYAATVTMFVPLLVIFSFRGKHLKMRPALQAFSVFLLALFLVGIVYSYTRAAWVSLAAAAGLYGMMMLRVKLVYVVLMASFLFGSYKYLENDIIYYLSKNEQDSDKSFKKHLKSIYNIKTDDSNLERINRWQSAFNMFQSRPIFGYGPGTYQFQYAPFQRSAYMTRISTNFGNQGTAHSEYFLPLSEQGLPGMLLVIALILITIHKGMELYYNSNIKRIRLLALGITLGYVTYFIHGFLNNYSDQDKTAVPIWVFTAFIVAMELYEKQKSPNKLRV